MAKKNRPLGPSLDLDENGDPVAEGFGDKLSRDLEIEREQPSLDILPPGYVRRAWRRKDRKRSPGSPRR